MHRRLLIAALFATAAAPSTASAQYFGRNKVQYRSFDFQVIRTEHFDVYYYPRERIAALDAARMIERSYGRLSRVLQHDFQERKPFIVYASHSDFQQTNALGGFIDESTGGATEALKSRMILPFTGSYADFDHVMTHELVHGFQYDVIFRRGVMTEASPFMARLPQSTLSRTARMTAPRRSPPPPARAPDLPSRARHIKVHQRRIPAMIGR